MDSVLYNMSFFVVFRLKKTDSRGVSVSSDALQQAIPKLLNIVFKYDIETNVRVNQWITPAINTRT